jgi:hypothetical protein
LCSAGSDTALRSRVFSVSTYFNRLTLIALQTAMIVAPPIGM